MADTVADMTGATHHYCKVEADGLRTKLREAQEELAGAKGHMSNLARDVVAVSKERDAAIHRLEVESQSFRQDALILWRQREEAKAERDEAKRAGIAASGKLLEAVLVGDQLARDYDAAIKRAEAAEALAAERLTILHNIDLGLQALLKTPADRPHSIERQWCVDLSMRLAQATPPTYAQEEGD